jgi:hypothetical protein
LYGTGPVLSSKRKARGWKVEKSQEELGKGIDPVVQRLLIYEGGEREVFPDALPWE